MNVNPQPDGSSGRGPINFWPPFIDLVTSALMVFVLVGFVDSVLRPEAVEAALLRLAQDRFLDSLRQGFAGEIDSGAMSVERNLDFVQITFSDSVLFDSGEYRLQPRGRRILDRCASVFHQAESTGLNQIQVEGHTDSAPVQSSGYPSDNWELSTARAIRVVQFLIARGVAPAALSANGYADQRPVSSNATATGRSRNRRIELRVFFSVQLPGIEAPP